MASTPTDMPDADSSSASTATLAPPAPPGDRPPTRIATGGPASPKRRRWVAWTVGILIAVVVIGALTGVVVWALSRSRSGGQSDFSAYRGAYESAMRKAGVSAPFPAAPVDITSVTSTGTHPFEATFTAEEITALVNVFTFSASVKGTSIAVGRPRIELKATDAVRLSGSVKLDGSSYSGSVEGPVRFESDRITSPGATKATAEGISVGGDRARQATAGLIDYLNLYVGASPGLTIASAEVTPEGFKVTGTAPDSLTLP